MLVTILAIETTGHSPRARRIRFDHTEPCTTSAAAVNLLGLVEGLVVDDDELQRALTEAEPDLAKQRAFRMLGYRERSTYEVRAGLESDGYAPATVTSVVDRLTELGLLDDDRFARQWAGSRAGAGYDRRRIQRELERRGVDPGLANDAVDDVAPVEGSLDRARRALNGRRAHDRKSRDRLVRRLVVRGFDLQTAIAAVADPETDQRAPDSPPV